eukprot:8656079-Pyramimonas_sp.AAC.1
MPTPTRSLALLTNHHRGLDKLRNPGRDLSDYGGMFELLAGTYQLASHSTVRCGAKQLRPSLASTFQL